ncbi:MULTISPECIES: hypothetical protein [Streptomyces]|nr:MULTISPECIES: hypothetical protein [Streptomyces]
MPEARVLSGRLGIANVYIGDWPTYWMAPGAHDSYLSDFLMRSKAVVGGL